MRPNVINIPLPNRVVELKVKLSKHMRKANVKFCFCETIAILGVSRPIELKNEVRAGNLLHPKTATATSRKRHENMIHGSYDFFVLKPALGCKFRGLWEEFGIVGVAGRCHRYASLFGRISQSE